MSLKHNFSDFQLHFRQGHNKPAIACLNRCFVSSTRDTFRELYTGNLIFRDDFLVLDFDEFRIGAAYRDLLRMIKAQVVRSRAAGGFLHEFSKLQLLQGAANYLEKSNAELKYNSKWAERHMQADAQYLETERQTVYITHAGLALQELLDRYYANASETEKIHVAWNLDTEEQFYNLFHELNLFCEMRNLVERFVFFGWSFESKGEKYIRVIQPPDKTGGDLLSEIVGQMKRKMIAVRVNQVAKEKLLACYLEYLDNPDSLPKEELKYIPDLAKESEAEKFAQAIMIDSRTDFTVERLLVSFNLHYYPIEPGLKKIKLDAQTEFPLRDTFRVLAFIIELSKFFIEKADEEYIQAVQHYGSTTKSFHAFMIENLTRQFSGDAAKISDAIKDYYNDDVQREQQKIIWKAKHQVANEYCLIRQDYDALVKTIQWLHPFETETIKKIINLFVYRGEPGMRVTCQPFFRIGNELCWLPNLVAHVSFDENLLNVLIGQELLFFDQDFTGKFECALQQVFKRFGFETVTDPKAKIFRKEDQTEAGDFDLLTFKDGHLLHFQLKLTNTRQSYPDMYTWREGVLKKAVLQLKKGNEQILKQKERIREILGLKADVPIDKVSSFIVSNSFLFDHERIGGFYKISFHELIYLLIGDETLLYEEDDYLRCKILEILEKNPDQRIPTSYRDWAERKANIDLIQEREWLHKFVSFHSEPLWKNNRRDAYQLVDHIYGKRLFGHLEKIPLVMRVSKIFINGYTLERPAMVQKTFYVI